MVEDAQRPSVKINANASGTPAKFDAIPENVRTAERQPARQSADVMAYAIRNPNTPPIKAVIRLSLMLDQ